MSESVYEETYRGWDDSTPLDLLVMEIDSLHNSVSHIFLVLKEYDHNQSFNVDTIYALSRAGMALLAEAEPILGAVNRRVALERSRVAADEPQTPPRGIAAASAASPGSLRAKMEAMASPEVSAAAGVRRASSAGADN